MLMLNELKKLPNATANQVKSIFKEVADPLPYAKEKVRGIKQCCTVGCSMLVSVMERCRACYTRDLACRNTAAGNMRIKHKKEPMTSNNMCNSCYLKDKKQ